MATFKETEHAGWTEKAGTYDAHFSGIASQAIDPILERLGDIVGLAVLDICCGTGEFSAAAQQRGARVTGIDFASTMIDIAAGKVPQASFVTGDAEYLDFEDDRFDAAVCSFGLWHLAEPDRALAEAARVLKPRGRFIYTTWLPPAKGWDMFRSSSTPSRSMDRWGRPAARAAPVPLRRPGRSSKCAFRARIPGYRLRGAHRHLARPDRAGRARLDL